MSDGDGYLDDAREYLADLSLRRLKDMHPFDVRHLYFLKYSIARRLLNTEKIKRGLITIADLSPPERRELIDPEDINLHALAAGPIMDSNQIFLPAGKISLDEAKARDAEQILPPTPGTPT